MGGGGARPRPRYPLHAGDRHLITTQPAKERAFLLGVLLPGVDVAAVDEQMRELAELTTTAGAEVVTTDVQRRDEVDPALYVGRGKIEEIRERRSELRYDLVICNEDLSPRQQRNLEKELKVKVVDRTELILDIFAQHARTREGRLQVESAQLHHTLPRLIGAWSYNRQTGGIGTRGGPGEQQIEVERRRIRRRLRDLDRELEEVRRQRDQQRRSRHASELETVAIVGYTNAGKSTLLNRLTRAEVVAENKLFATLDPTTRRLRLASGRELLVTDTVGFIQKLPTDLVASFRATLEEVTYSDIVLQVIDGSAPAALEHARTVDDVLEDLGAAEKPRVVAVNKVDLLGLAGRRRVLGALGERYRRVVPVSALTGAGIDDLLAVLEEVASRDLVPVRMLVPYGREGVLHELRVLGDLEGSEFTEGGTLAWGRAPRTSLHRFQQFLVAG